MDTAWEAPKTEDYDINAAKTVLDEDHYGLEDVKKRCEQFGATVYADIIDVTDNVAMNKWIEESNKIATLNIIIANAGVSTGEENENNINDFLSRHGEFSLEPWRVGNIYAKSGMITLLPHIHGTDGFFIAKLKRNI